MSANFTTEAAPCDSGTRERLPPRRTVDFFGATFPGAREPGAGAGAGGQGKNGKHT